MKIIYTYINIHNYYTFLTVQQNDKKLIKERAKDQQRGIHRYTYTRTEIQIKSI